VFFEQGMPFSSEGPRVVGGARGGGCPKGHMVLPPRRLFFPHSARWDASVDVRGISQLVETVTSTT
jgi:hypothetical protein